MNKPGFSLPPLLDMWWARFIVAGLIGVGVELLFRVLTSSQPNLPLVPQETIQFVLCGIVGESFWQAISWLSNHWSPPERLAWRAWEHAGWLMKVGGWGLLCVGAAAGVAVGLSIWGFFIGQEVLTARIPSWDEAAVALCVFFGSL